MLLSTHVDLGADAPANMSALNARELDRRARPARAFVGAVLFRVPSRAGVDVGVIDAGCRHPDQDVA